MHGTTVKKKGKIIRVFKNKTKLSKVTIKTQQQCTISAYHVYEYMICTDCTLNIHGSVHRSMTQ